MPSLSLVRGMSMTSLESVCSSEYLELQPSVSPLAPTPPCRTVLEHSCIMSMMCSALDREDQVQFACASRSHLEVATPLLWRSIEHQEIEDLVRKYTDLVCWSPSIRNSSKRLTQFGTIQTRLNKYLQTVRVIDVGTEELRLPGGSDSLRYNRLYPNLTRVNFVATIKDDQNTDHHIVCGKDRNGGSWDGLWLKFLAKTPATLRIFRNEDLGLSSTEEGQARYSLLGLDCPAHKAASVTPHIPWDPSSLLCVGDGDEEGLRQLLGSLKVLRLPCGPVRYLWLASVLPYMKKLQVLDITIAAPLSEEELALPLFEELLSLHCHHLLDLTMRYYNPTEEYFLPSFTSFPIINNLHYGRLRYLQVSMQTLPGEDDEGTGDSLLQILATGKDPEDDVDPYQCDAMDILVTKTHCTDTLTAALYLVKYIEPSCYIQVLPLEPKQVVVEAGVKVDMEAQRIARALAKEEADEITTWAESVLKARDMLILAERKRNRGPGYMCHGRIGAIEGGAGFGGLAAAVGEETGGEEGGEWVGMA